MEIQEYQNDFSQLYQQLQSDLPQQNSNTIQHPFSFYSLYPSTEEIPYNKTDFKQSLVYQKDILKQASHAYDCFSLEMGFLNDKKGKYLNTIIDYLLEQYDLSQDNNIIIANSIRHLFYMICESQFNIFVNSSNRNKLSKWHTLKEPIKSFKSKIVYEDKWLEVQIFNPLKRDGFLSEDTSFATFKTLFSGKYLESKINWIDNKSSLIYFIKRLLSKNLVDNPKNKHWEIASEFFLIKGESIMQSELLNQKETTNKRKREAINKKIDNLVQY